MITLTPQLKEIQKYHQYDYKTGHSDWSLGLNQGKYVNGSILDNLRNNLTCAEWLILISIPDEKINLLPLKIQNDVTSARLGLLKDCAHVEGEFKDWISEKKPGYQSVQKALWKTMMAHYEAMKFIASGQTAEEYEADRLSAIKKYEADNPRCPHCDGPIGHY